MASLAKDADQQAVLKAAMLDVLKAQKKAFLEELPVSAKVRINRLDRAIAILVDHKDKLVDAMDEDYNGRPKSMSLFTDIASAVKALKFARKHVKGWMRPEPRSLEFPLGLLGAKGWIEYQPKGVVGLISPWNFPVNLTFGPLAGIFAAGNRVMIKPSEITPNTADVMESLFKQYFDSEEVSVITGGPEAGEAFSSLPFDHLLFTGATSIGRHVMRAASENLTPVTLELGGKSPAILSRKADLAQAAERVVMGKMMNAGQVCLAPDYLLVPEEGLDSTLSALEDATARLYPTIKGNADYGAVVNGRHKARLEGYIDDAKEKGADIRVVNPAGETFSHSDNNTQMPLHLVCNVTDDMTVMQDEIFGPILPLVPYSNIDQAIAYINRRERPLALYYLGDDRREERKALDKTIAGGITLNDVVWHIGHEDLPFGGVGHSGMGYYHGWEGFQTFSHTKSIYRQTRVNLAKLIGVLPPYGERLKKVLSAQIKK